MNKKILIIDDDEDFVAITKTIFESKSFQCVSAYSAKEGLQKIKEENPDLIIVDVMMEDMTAGFRLVNTLRTAEEGSEYNAYSNIPLLMVTVFEDVTKIDIQKKAGTTLLPVDEFMRKPVKPRELLTKAEKMLA
ncbi:response regulator [bacterium (candidate division B38) B3_B38]|nr:MAG: response regulator [bacterium (candidate division B38) B3_B38]